MDLPSDVAAAALGLALGPGHHCVVGIAMAPELARRRLPGELLADEPDGGVVLRCEVTDLDALARALALLDAHLVVHAPEELRDALARLGARLTAAALRGSS